MKTSMSSAGFKPKIPAIKQLQTYTLDHTGRLPLQWQQTSDILTGYTSSLPMICTNGCYYSP